MRANILQELIQLVRTQRTGRQLGGVRAFTAGVINAGGFLVVQRYTSNMTGIVSAMGRPDLGAPGLGAGRSRIADRVYLRGGNHRSVGHSCAPSRASWGVRAPSCARSGFAATVWFVGRQSRVVWRMVRTGHRSAPMFHHGCTEHDRQQDLEERNQDDAHDWRCHGPGHRTGPMDPWWRSSGSQWPAHDEERCREAGSLYTTILGLFVGGGIVGAIAIAFAVVGFAATVPFAVMLMTLAALPMLQDLKSMGDGSIGDVP